MVGEAAVCGSDPGEAAGRSAKTVALSWLWDLVKFYERISHVSLARRAVAERAPLFILRCLPGLRRREKTAEGARV